MKVTKCFMPGKLLMFPKHFLKSFTYYLAQIFYFPSEIVTGIYKKYQIEKVEMYHILTDTDRIASQFIIISNPKSDVPKAISFLKLLLPLKFIRGLIYLMNFGTFLGEQKRADEKG